ncbi:MAG: ABC transporter substrate-binding protein [Alphaproteobacteria bacterium]|nr:ABC transporter substrate-binding protein [Alphaproteobacteria bacterium]
MKYLIYIPKTNLKFNFSFYGLYISILVFFIGSISQGQNLPNKTIAITQIAQHPSLDLIRQGIIDELKDQGYHKDKNLQIYYENAHGNITSATQIAQKFIGIHPDVIIAITTPSAQTIFKANQASKIPMVFSAVTDPLGAGLVTRLDKPSGFVTGIIDFPPIKQQLLFIKKIMPDIKRIGVIYNPGEINAVKQIQAFEKHAQAFGLLIIKSPASKTSDVFSATQYLIHEVDAIYVANDNTIVSALEAILKVTFEYKIPLFASDGESVTRGALFALANNQYQVGRDTGKQVIKILQGSLPADLPVLASNKTELYFNERSAKMCMIKIPFMLSKQAQQK